MKAIIEKQRELIELLKAPRYHEINDAIKRKESELAALESEQPKDGAKDKQRKSAEEIWPNKVRLYMIEKSKFYEDERIYQYGFYDGYQYASQSGYPEELTKLWINCEAKRQLLISRMHDSSNPSPKIYNQIMSVSANIICDIMDEIKGIIDKE